MNAPYHPPRALHRLIARCAPLPRTRATLQDLTVPAGSDSWEMDAASTLRRHGCVVLRGLIDADVARLAGRDWTARIRGAMGTLGERPHHEDGAWGAQRGSAHWLTYGDLASAGKTIFHLRTGRDEGMVDVFNVDLHEDLSDHDRTIRNALLSQSVMSLIDKAFRPSLAPTNLNLYLNRDILETRGLHFDDLRFRVKAFAYLTDVDDPSAGPYTYVPGSHRSTRHQKVTMWLNRRSGQERPLTDATLVSDDAGVRLLGPAGSIIISDQRGIHRGWPQSVGSERIAMVQAYDT